MNEDRVKYEQNQKKFLRGFKENVLEEIFLLIYKTSMTYEEASNLPITKRKWFVNRLIKQIELENPQKK
jgi:hypothetical protein